MTKPLILALLCGLAASTAIAAGAPKPKPPPDVLVVSDVFSDVPDSLLPKPGKPIFYHVLGKLENDIGTPIAGEPRADPVAMELAMTKMLAKQGFMKAVIGGPMPSIALVITWGSANLDTMEMTIPPLPQPSFGPPDPTALPPPPPPESVLISFNRREIEMLVGADKANRTVVDPTILSQINDAATSSRAYIFIAALDIETLLKTKKKKLLWRTRMSIPSTHHSLPESIDVMLASAAPYLARESAAPVFINEADRRKAEVRVGTPVVVPDKPTDDAKKTK
jgi:hypothetical protein